MRVHFRASWLLLGAILAPLIGAPALRAQAPATRAADEKIAVAVSELAELVRTRAHVCLGKSWWQGVRVAVAGFNAEAVEIDGELGGDDARRITAEVLARLGRERSITVRSLADWGDVYFVLTDQHGLPAVRKRVGDAMARIDSDLLLCAHVLRRTGAGALDVALSVVSPANDCRQSVTISELPAAAPSQLRPQAVMALAARDFFKANPEATKVIIERAPTDPDHMTEPRADYLERLLQAALEKEAQRRQSLESMITGERTRFTAPRVRDLGPLPGEAKAWRAQLQLRAVPQGVELDVRLNRSGETPVNVSRFIALNELPVARPGPITVVSGKARYAVKEPVEFRLVVAKASHLYCLMEDPAKRKALVLLPLPGPAPKAHADRDAPYLLTGPDFGFDSREGFHGTVPGAYRMRCFAAPAPLPAAQHARWVAHHVIERKARKEPLVFPVSEIEPLIAALASLGAKESIANVQVAAE